MQIISLGLYNKDIIHLAYKLSCEKNSMKDIYDPVKARNLNGYTFLELTEVKVNNISFGIRKI